MRDPINPVIAFSAEGFDVSRPELMGRHVANHGFLRAAVTERGPGPLHAYAANRPAAEAFAHLAKSVDPAVECRWIRPTQLREIGAAGGVLYRGGSGVPELARTRQRAGVAAYSICGLTHTTANAGTMQAIADLLTAPVAPWDALVCTTTAVAETVRRVHAEEAENLRWRLGRDVRIAPPQLPVIPLGVHCADYAFTDAERAQARDALGLGPDDIAALFVGRLHFAAKTHPFAMYRGLQLAAERTGRRVTLVLCGWSPNPSMAKAFTESPAKFCPDVRTVIVDGREPGPKREAWAAADLFVSLSDNIQETFGLTPIEAMAAGLPVVVTDWNGYKDTVRDGVDGFRVRTWAPAGGAAGEGIALEQQAGEINYDRYIWNVAAATAVDLRELTDRFCALIEDPDLRRRMGEAGRARARQVFDWPVVFRQYQALWAELNARRAAAHADPAEAAWIAAAPRHAPAWPDPFAAHGHYPTRHIGPDTLLTLSPEGTLGHYGLRKADVLFDGVRLPDQVAANIMARLGQGPMTLEALAANLNLAQDALAYVTGILAKMGLLELSP